jgi:hypothetical protein
MDFLEFLLVLFALVCFLAAASGKVTAKWNLVALGLASWVAVDVIERWPGS